MKKEMNNSIMSINEAVMAIKSQIEEGCPMGIKSGLMSLDSLIGGFSRGELCVIGAQPAMGKSMFVLSVISYMTWKKIPIGLFSATDDYNVCFLSRVVSAVENIYPGFSNEYKLGILQNASLDNTPLFLTLNANMTISLIRENAIKLKEEKGIKCLFIETIQSVFDAEEGGNTSEGMKRVCRELKVLAQELEIPIIITSDIKRPPKRCYGITGKYPHLGDFKCRSAIETYADKVLLLYRPEYYCIYKDENGKDMKGKMIVIVAKNKYGTIGEIRLQIDSIKCLLTDMDGSLRDKEEQKQAFNHMLQESEPFRALSEKFELDILDSLNEHSF